MFKYNWTFPNQNSFFSFMKSQASHSKNLEQSQRRTKFILCLDKYQSLLMYQYFKFSFFKNVWLYFIFMMHVF